MPDLVALLNDPETEVRVAAAWALGEMPPLPAEANKALLGLLSERPWNVRATALLVLRAADRMPPTRPRGEVAALLKKPDAGVRRWALSTLGEDWVHTETFLPEFIPLLHDADAGVRRAAVAVLGNAGPRAKECVPKLIPLLDDNEPNVRMSAAKSLSQFGPDAVASVPELVKLFGDPDTSARIEAIDAVGGIGPAAKSAIPDLIRLLHGENMVTRRAAAAALGRMGAEAKAAIPDLVGLIGNFDRHNSFPICGNCPIMFDNDVAESVLCEWGFDAVPEIVKLTHSSEDSLRLAPRGPSAVSANMPKPPCRISSVSCVIEGSPCARRRPLPWAILRRRLRP